MRSPRPPASSMPTVVIAVLGGLMLMAAAGCGLRVDDRTATAGRATTSAPAGAPAPSTTEASVSITKGPTTTTALTTTAPPTTVPPTTPTTTAPAFDVTAYCAAEATIDLTDLTKLAVFTPEAAADLYTRFDALAAAAPPELVTPFAQMRPIFDEGKRLIDAGQITTAQGFVDWVGGLIAANDPIVVDFVAAQRQSVIPFNQATCP